MDETDCWYEASRRLSSGEKPTYSSGICGDTTAGYGKLDEYGYWEYPLFVNQETFEVRGVGVSASGDF